MSLLMEALRKAEQSKAAVEKKEVADTEAVAITAEKNLPEKNSKVDDVNFGSLTLQAKNLLPEQKSEESFLDGLTFGDSVEEQKKILKKTKNKIDNKDESLSISESNEVKNSESSVRDLVNINNTKDKENHHSELDKTNLKIGLIENKNEQKTELLSGLINDKKAFISNDSEVIGRAVLAAKIGADTKEKRNKTLTLSLVVVILAISGLFLYQQIFDQAEGNSASALIQDNEFDYIDKEYEEFESGVEVFAESNESLIEIQEEAQINNIKNELVEINNTQILAAEVERSIGVVELNQITSNNPVVSTVQDTAADPREPQVNTSLFTSREVINEVDSLIDTAYQAYQQGNFIDAKYYYEGVLEKNPGHRGALLGLSSIAIKEGRESSALENYSRLLERDPSDPLAQAGIFNVTEADPLSQESGIKQLINDYPQLPHLEFALGNIYSYQSRWSEAQQAYFNALEKAKATTVVLAEISPDYAYNLAISLEYLNKPELAMQYYKEALENATLGSANFDISIVQNRLKTLSQ